MEAGLGTLLGTLGVAGTGSPFGLGLAALPALASPAMRHGLLSGAGQSLMTRPSYNAGPLTRLLSSDATAPVAGLLAPLALPYFR